ncbi:MAG: SDR family NAD(P)-dependent oxidoreductase [Gammaproteobacteria bacterium]|nr:SDR family NAD(P)-dependent oxidoreductase [Gammaproteobacteria bacterium]
MEIRLDGRNALITGGSMGLGRAMAQTFATSGANVAMVARRADALAEAKAEIEQHAKTKIVAIAGDVSTAAGCQAVAEEAASALGPVDILVNNAGSSARSPFEAVTDEDWQQDLDLKLFAAIRLCRLFLPHMKSQRWGRIINVLNTGAKAPPAEGAPTAVSRAAGLALTKVLAGEGAAHNVLVNGLMVGKIQSDQWVRRHEAAGTNESMEAFYEKMGADLPLGRVGTAQEFANVACLLASDAGGYVSGTAINVDGGLCPVV